MFDFAVNIPRPTEDAQILRWRDLFWAARYFRHEIIESDKGCSGITIIDGAAFNAHRGDGILRAGHEYTNTAPSGPLDSLNPAEALEYLFTGEITGTEEPYQLTVRLEAAYSREAVKSVSVPISGTIDSAQAVGQALANQFLPLQQVIAEWERTKRESDTEVARANPDGKMTIAPRKRALLEGEETELAVTLTDCDGAPLPNREVDFVSGSWPKIGRLDGTSGGEVKPSSGTTDQNGQLKVRFTAGKAGIARVNAWYGLFRPTGRPAAILGNSTIQIKPSKPDAARPARGWTGDINYHSEYHVSRQEGLVTDNDSRIIDYTFYLPPSGDPTVTFNSHSTDRETHIYGGPCPQSAGEIMRGVKAKERTSIGTIDTETSVSGTYPAGDVIVKVNGGIIGIFASPGLFKVKTKITKTLKTTEQCPGDPPPDDSSDTTSYEEETSTIPFLVNTKAQPDSDVQQGTYTMPNNLGVVTWNLKRTSLK